MHVLTIVHHSQWSIVGFEKASGIRSRSSTTSAADLHTGQNASPVKRRSPLAKVPYRFQHSAVSLWLNVGVPTTQVAEWTGHSVNVLLKVYAKCIDGQDEPTRRRVEAALLQRTTANRPCSYCAGTPTRVAERF